LILFINNDIINFISCNKKNMTKKSSVDKAYKSSFFTSLLVIFVICFGIALAALILTGVLYTKSNSSEICQNCLGIVNTVITDNGTLSPIDSQSLTFHGINGIRIELSNPTIIVDDKRWITEYVVRSDGTGEFLSPQEAYNQAILDGRGGDDLPAVILIGPGTYSFGDTQFPITQTGISWVSLPAASGATSNVIFTATSSTGGILVDAVLNFSKFVLFQGITFGGIGDSIGFLLNHTQGQCQLISCASLDSNFRIVTGQEGFFTILGATDCVFQTLPPNDFVKTSGPNGVVVFKGTTLLQLGFGAPVTVGGYLFNLEEGISSCQLTDCFVIMGHYNAIFKGPTTGLGFTSGGVIGIKECDIQLNDANPTASVIIHTGTFRMTIVSSTFIIQGSLIYQIEDSLAGEIHDLECIGSFITSKNATIANEPIVAIIGNNNYRFFTTYLKTNPDIYIINLPSSTNPDTLTVRLTSVTVDTQSPSLGAYALGPGALVSNLEVGNSISISGANTATGFTYVPLTSI
jgi:hypothetical protein